MKELKLKKETKKKPGEFLKKKKKFQNIQHNRDQLKLLKEGKIEKAELFILDNDAFKKVTIKPFPEVPYDVYANYQYVEVVYLSHGGKKSRLRTSQLIGKDAFPRCQVMEGFIPWKYCFGIVIKTELLVSKKDAKG